MLVASVDAYHALIPLCKNRKLLGFDHPTSFAKRKIQTATRENPALFIEMINNLIAGKPQFWRYIE